MSQFQRRQLTLVSHYGPKPESFVRLIRDLQGKLLARLEGLFEPYATEQVHGTVIGLEGSCAGQHVRNENFWRSRGEERAMDFDALLNFLRSSSMPEIEITIGGFKADQEYPFTSQGVHPYERSFSIQKRRVVAMGWPWGGTNRPGALEALRQRFQDFGVLHKWHARLDSIDDDFFFVLGTLRAELPDDESNAIESDLRHELSIRPPCLLTIRNSTLSFVEYDDPQLPPARSRAHGIRDSDVTPATLRAVYSAGD